MINQKKAVFRCIFSLIVLPVIFLAFYACNNTPEGEGTFTIRIGGTNSRSTLTWDTSTNISDLDISILLFNSAGVEKYRRDKLRSGVPASFTVVPGYYDIRVEAYLGVILKAVGSASITVNPGPNGSVPVQMGPPELTLSGIIIITLNGDEIIGPVPTGSTLTAEYYSGTERVSYQWNFNGDPMPTAILQELIPGEAGLYTVTVSASGYASKTSDPVVVEGASIPELEGSVTIEGTAKVGQTVTANADVDGNGDISYFWERSDAADAVYTPISGAAEDTYTLIADDYGKYIKVTVTRPPDRSGSKSSPAFGPVATGDLEGSITFTVNGGVISGPVPTGSTLVVVCSGQEHVSYQWNFDNDPMLEKTLRELIPGEAGTYTVTVSAYGYVSKTSDPVVVEGPTILPLQGNVTIEGTAKVGQILTANADVDGTGDISYFWERSEGSGAVYYPIKDATENTYALIADDYGKHIRVTVTRPPDRSGSISSGAIGPVAQGELEESVSIFYPPGAAFVGTMLIANYNGTESVTYQWYKNGVPIYGETGDTCIPATIGRYTLTVSARSYISKPSDEVIIDPADPIVTWPARLTATYGQTLSDISLPGNGASTPSGTFTWTMPSTTSVGDAGPRSHSMTFTPTDTTNYNTLIQNVNITVDKANPIVTWPTGLAAIAGQTLSNIMLPDNTGTAGRFTWQTSASLSVGTRSYNMTFNPDDDDNYKAPTQGVSVTTLVRLTWEAASNNPFSGYASNATVTIRDLAYGGGNFVVASSSTVGNDNIIAYSTNNGQSWSTAGMSAPTSYAAAYFSSIAYGSNKFVAVGTYETFTSTSGTSWTRRELGNLQAIAFGDGKFVAGGSGGIRYSSDGISWTAAEGEGNNLSVYAIAYGSTSTGSGMFVAGGYQGKMSYSVDGITWTSVADSTFDTSASIGAIEYGNGKFVAVRTGSSSTTTARMAYSDDGITWTAVANSVIDTQPDGYTSTGSITDITYGNGMFVAAGTRSNSNVYNTIWCSVDGINWATVDNIFAANAIQKTAYGSGRFVFVISGTTRIAYSQQLE